jgi:hypothetical protein
LILAILLAFIPTPALAQTGTVGFSTVITYQNIGSSTAHITLLFYPEGQSNPISISRPDLPAGASATVATGSIGSGAGFRGSAVVKSDVQLAVTMTQVPSVSTVKSRPMAAGFIQGSSEIWFLYAYKGAPVSTVISVQNLDNKPANLTLTFHGGSTPVTLTKNNVPAGTAAFFDLSTIESLGIGYIGTVQVKSVRAGTTTLGKIAGMQLNLTANGDSVYANESVSQVGKKVYMPIALCSALGGMSTSYYVYNTDSSVSTTVTITYSSTKKGTINLAPNQGAWYNACLPSGTTTGYSGHAVVTSSATDILVLGHAKDSGMSATFYGQSVGANILAVPYANYSTSYYTAGTRQRTTLYIMNLGSSLASGAVKVKYYDKNGKLLGTHSLGAIGSGVKVESTPNKIGSAGAEFGYYSDGSTGGSAIIEGPAGSNLMAAVWVVSNPAKGSYIGEMYNAIPLLLAP